MSNVLDIGQFAEDTGFITSSDDEGDGFQRAAKSNLGARLAGIFESESGSKPSKNSENVEKPIQQTIFASSGEILVDPKDGPELDFSGKAGIAIIVNPAKETSILLIYDANKKPLYTLSLSERPLANYTETRSDGFKWLVISVIVPTFMEVHIRPTSSDLFWHFVALINLCQNMPFEMDVNLGDQENHVVTKDDGALCDIQKYTMENGKLQFDQAPESIKVNLSKKSKFRPLILGMRKNDKKLCHVEPNLVCFIEVKKVKSRIHHSETANIEPTNSESKVDEPHIEENAIQNPETQPEISSAEISMVEETPGQSLVERMAKIGTAILPMPGIRRTVSPIERSKSPDQIPSTNEPETVASVQVQESRGKLVTLEKPSIGQNPIQNPDYEAFHRVVGVEMDRLEIRLNATLERLLTPIRNEMAELRSRQNRILEALDKVVQKE
ncbi:hypothetical protein WR25_26437 [Diploscapter pachys]|uniref:Uncharacterized protein n=1 Tax=Diploscapter pachys TaxID=2018661 RepID=A0A2A2JM55_9BILA|nr:hypothetical protein WR25_26437 [Diploscapter pachys]